MTVKSKTIRYNKDGSIDLIELPVRARALARFNWQAVSGGICSWDIATCKLGEQMNPPAPPGHEGMGYVTKIGPGVRGLRKKVTELQVAALPPSAIFRPARRTKFRTCLGRHLLDCGAGLLCGDGARPLPAGAWG